MTSTLDLLQRLHDAGFHMVIVGGVAGAAHGSSFTTTDLDVSAPLDSDNIARLLAALAGLNPRWRMQPTLPPIPQDPAGYAGFKNLYIRTTLGDLDVLGEIAGIGAAAAVEANSEWRDFAGIRCRVITLDALIRAKRALGRPKDLAVATELEAIRGRHQSSRGEES